MLYYRALLVAAGAQQKLQRMLNSLCLKLVLILENPAVNKGRKVRMEPHGLQGTHTYH